MDCKDCENYKKKAKDFGLKCDFDAIRDILARPCIGTACKSCAFVVINSCGRSKLRAIMAELPGDD